MKRFSKILAVLLSVCLIAGLIAVFASADDTDPAEKHRSTVDSIKDSGHTGSSLDGWTSNADGSRASSASDLYNTEYVIVSVGEDENKYFRIYANTKTAAGSASTGTGNYGWELVPPETGAVDSYDYVVLEYLFRSEGLNYPGTDMNITTDHGVSPAVNYATTTIVEESGSYYVKDKNSSNKVALSTVDGDWNTFTIVATKTASYTYINGEYLCTRDISSFESRATISSIQLKGTKLNDAGDNFCLDGISYRCYGDGNGTYASQGFGVDDLVAAPTTTSVYECTDVAYNYSATSATFPKSNVYVDSVAQVHTQTVVAEVEGVSYVFIDGALAALENAQEKLIKVYANAAITGVTLDSFIVEAYNGAAVTLPEGYAVETENGDGVFYHELTKVVNPAYIGDTPYDTVADALLALGEGGTVKIMVGATIPANTLNNFNVEAYNGAVVTFAGEVLRNHDVERRVGQSATYYTVTARPAITEYRDDFDGTFSSGETVSVTENGKVINKYLKLTSGATLNLLSGESNVSRLVDNKYAVTQYLFSAEGGNYMTGTIALTDSVNSNVCTLTISSVTQSDDSVKYYVTATEGDASISTVELATNGDWNVVTIIQHSYEALAAGTAQGQRSAIYVNGVCVGRKQQSGDALRGALTKLTVTKSADGNLIFDGFNARFYRSGQTDANVPTYTAPAGVYSIADRDYKNSPASYNTNDFGDIFYNKYSTTLDYPATLFNSAVHTQSGAVAEVNGVGYFDLGTALGALENNGTIKIFANETIAGVNLKKFYVEAYNGAVPTIEGYEVTSEAIDGGTRYTATAPTPPSVDGVEYDDVASALAAIKNGSVVKFYTAATITGVTADNFTVEVYDGANVTFDPVFLRTYKVTKRLGSGVVIYTVVKQNHKTFVDSFDTLHTATNDAWNKTQVTAGDNKYMKLEAVGSSGALNYKVLSEASSVPTLRDARYTVIQFLLGAENGVYADGTFIKPTRTHSIYDYNTNIGGIEIRKDGTDYYAHYVESAGGTSKGNTKLTQVAGDWNVVTIVIDEFAAHTVASSGMGLRAYFYVNGAYIGGRDQSGLTSAHGTLQILAFTASKTPVAGANLLIDGYVARYYLNDGVAAGETATYTTPDTIGIDEFFKIKDGSGEKATNEEFATLQDLYYSKYSTTEDYPKTLVKGQPHTQSGAVAEINGVGYFDLDTAWNALAEGGTITFNADYTVPATTLQNFTVLYAEGVDVNIDALAESHKDTAIDGGWSFVPAVKYNVVYKYGDTEIDRKEISIEQAPTPSEVVWSAYIKGDASLVATWMIKIGDADAVVWNGASWNEATISEGMTVIVYPAEDSIVTLTWNGIEGREDKYFKGSAPTNVVYPELSGEVIEKLNNNWYDLAYGWAELPEAINEDIEVQQTLVPVANVKAKFSYTLGLRFYPTFYLPVADDNANVTVNGANYVANFFSHYTYDGEMPDDLRDVIDTSKGTVWGVIEDLGLKTVGEVSYYVGKTDIRPENLECVTAFQVNFTVNYNGVDYELCAPLFSSFLSDYTEEEHHVLNYAEKVLTMKDKDGNLIHDSGTKLVAEFLRLFMLANDGASTEKANELLALHAVCACAPKPLDDAVPTPEEAAGFTHEGETMPADMKISFRTDANAGGFQLYLPTSFVSQYASVKVSTLPIGGIIDNAYVNENTEYQVFDKQDAGVDDLTDYTRFRAHHDQDQFKLFNFACRTKFKIVCTHSEGEAVTYEFTYSLAEYLYDLQSSDAVAANTISDQLGKAYMNFVVAAFNYKSGK